MVEVVLIGYRGSGKTTVGRLLAKRRGIDFVDTDERIVAEAGRSIAEIFASEGKGGFRARESAAIASAAGASGRCVLSVGGGAVEIEANRTLLKSLGPVLWLDAPAELLWQRIQADPATTSNRPNLSGGGLDEVRTILARRRPLYAALADVTIDATTDPARIVEQIDAWLAERGKP
jgi:shikimate kinase